MQATADETFVLYAVLHTHKEGTDATSVPQQLFSCAIPAPRCGNVPIFFLGSLALVTERVSLSVN